MIDLIDVLTNQGVKKVYTVCLEMDTFSYQMGDFPVLEKEPVELSIVSPSKNKVVVNGFFRVKLGIPCDRCLTEVSCQVDVGINRSFIIGEAPEDESEEEFLPDTVLDVENLLFTEILINLPAKVLCKNDCKGICKVCGKNLNEGECGCDRRVLDPRMAAVLDAFHNFGKSSD